MRLSVKLRAPETARNGCGRFVRFHVQTIRSERDRASSKGGDERNVTQERTFRSSPLPSACSFPRDPQEDDGRAWRPTKCQWPVPRLRAARHPAVPRGARRRLFVPRGGNAAPFPLGGRRSEPRTVLSAPKRGRRSAHARLRGVLPEEVRADDLPAHRFLAHVAPRASWERQPPLTCFVASTVGSTVPVRSPTSDSKSSSMVHRYSTPSLTLSRRTCIPSRARPFASSVRRRTETSRTLRAIPNSHGAALPSHSSRNRSRTSQACANVSASSSCAASSSPDRRRW